MKLAHKTSSHSLLPEHPLVYLAERAPPPTPTPRSPSTHAAFGIPAIDSVLPYGGLPHGAIHEFFSPFPYPPLCLLTRLAHSTIINKPLLWIGEDCIPTPQFLAHHSETLFTHSIFIKTTSPKNTLWAIDTALQCKGIWGVIAAARTVTLPIMRKLSLSVRHSSVFFFLVRPLKEKALSSNALSRWEILPQGLSLLRYKGHGFEPTVWNIDVTLM